MGKILKYYNIDDRIECVNLVTDAFDRLRDSCREKDFISLSELVKKGLFIDLEYQQEVGFDCNLPGLVSTRNTWLVPVSIDDTDDNKQAEIIKDILKAIVGTVEQLYRQSVNTETHELCSECYICFRIKGDTLFTLDLENMVDRRKRFEQVKRQVIGKIKDELSTKEQENGN